MTILSIKTQTSKKKTLNIFKYQKFTKKTPTTTQTNTIPKTNPKITTTRFTQILILTPKPMETTTHSFQTCSRIFSPFHHPDFDFLKNLFQNHLSTHDRVPILFTK